MTTIETLKKFLAESKANLDQAEFTAERFEAKMGIRSTELTLDWEQAAFTHDQAQRAVHVAEGTLNLHVIITSSTKNLIGRSLDYAVALAQGWVNYPTDTLELGTIWHTAPERAPLGPIIAVSAYVPSTNREQGGLLIEREKISTVWSFFQWCSTHGDVSEIYTRDEGNHFQGTGPTPLIAGMRCFVESRLGLHVAIPVEFQLV